MGILELKNEEENQPTTISTALLYVRYLMSGPLLIGNSFYRSERLLNAG